MAGPSGEDRQLAALEQAMGLPPGSLTSTGSSAKKVAAAPQLWLPGKKKTTHAQAYEGNTFRQHGMVQTKTSYQGRGSNDAQDVSNWVYDAGKLKQIQSYLEKRGFEVNSWSDVNKYWQSAVQQASDAYESSGHKIKKSPWDMLDLVAPTKDEIAKRGPYRGMSFDQTHTTRSIDEIGPEQAKAVLTASLKDLLGRDPTKEEIEDFASHANAIVGAHPEVTTSTSHMVWDPQANGGNGGYIEKSSDSRTTGGIDVGAMLQNEATDMGKSDKDYGEFQAATTVSNWLFDAVNSPE